MKADVPEIVNILNYTTAADPHPEIGDIMVKVEVAMVCRTDIRILRGSKTTGIRFPSILGNLFAGVVADNGGNSQYKIGESVCVCPQFTCDHCDYCIRGVEKLCCNMAAMSYE